MHGLTCHAVCGEPVKILIRLKRFLKMSRLVLNGSIYSKICTDMGLDVTYRFLEIYVNNWM